MRWLLVALRPCIPKPSLGPDTSMAGLTLDGDPRLGACCAYRELPAQPRWGKRVPPNQGFLKGGASDRQHGNPQHLQVWAQDSADG